MWRIVFNPDAASKHKHMECWDLSLRTVISASLYLVPSTSVVPKANFCRVGSLWTVSQHADRDRRWQHRLPHDRGIVDEAVRKGPFEA
jgi:hypothetical protein